MDRLERYSRRWYNQQISAPWQSVMDRHANKDDSAESAKAKADLVEEAVRRAALLDQSLTSLAPQINAVVADATMSMLRSEKQLLITQVQALQNQLEDSKQSHSDAQESLDAVQREQHQLLARVDEQGRQLRSALENQHRGDSTRAELEKELDQHKVTLQDIRAENDRLKREASKAVMSQGVLPKAVLVTQSRGQVVRVQGGEIVEISDSTTQEALRRQKGELENFFEERLSLSLESQRQAFDRAMKKALSEQQDRLDMTFEKSLQLHLEKRSSEFERVKQHALHEQKRELDKAYQIELREQLEDPVAAEHLLHGVSKGLNAGARKFGFKFAGSDSLAERACNLADWGMLRVSRSYRAPIERLCREFDIRINGWPDMGHSEYYANLAKKLDRVFEDIRHKFREQEKCVQRERAHWLEKFRAALEAAGDDVRALEGTLDSNYRLGKHVEQHFKDLDGEGGLIERFIFFQKTSRSVIEGQQKRIAEVTACLIDTNALADQLMLAIRASQDTTLTDNR